MGKNMRKCREIGELAVMEVSQVVGVRTRAMTTALASAAARSRKAASSNLEVRNRRLVMKPRISRNSGSPRSLMPNHCRISRCSSNTSSEVAESRYGDREVAEDSESAVCYFHSLSERSDKTQSSSRINESYDLESTAGRQAPRRSTAAMTPSDAEIEEFFAAAELKESQRFAKTYNFDVVNDAPLEGRYEWVGVAL